MIQLNKFGFSLLEAIIAMGIIAVMAVPLVVMQSSSLRFVLRDANHADRIFLMRNFLYEARNNTPSSTTTFTYEKKVVNPNTDLRYQLLSPQVNSSLHGMKGIYVEQITATWNEMGKTVQDVMVTTKYIAPEPEKKAAS